MGRMQREIISREKLDLIKSLNLCDANKKLLTFSNPWFKNIYQIVIILVKCIIHKKCKEEIVYYIDIIYLLILHDI